MEPNHHPVSQQEASPGVRGPTPGSRVAPGTQGSYSPQAERRAAPPCLPSGMDSSGGALGKTTWQSTTTPSLARSHKQPYGPDKASG